MAHKANDNSDKVIMDFTGIPEETTDLYWRQHAVELAIQRHTIGQVYHVKTDTVTGYQFYTCISAHEPQNYRLVYDPKSGAVLCGCFAGQFRNPCSHAGATLLLALGLASPRKRPERRGE